jgi:hypothetical protein
MSMQNFLDLMKQVVVVISVLGVLLYALILLAYAFGNAPAKKLLETGKPSFMFGLPISGAVAFAIVCVLDTVAPATRDDTGKLAFKAFGLAFSGPAGPVTLWVVVYLTLIVSMRLTK